MADVNKPVALRVNHVSKSFKLPHEKHSTLKSLIINPFSNAKSYEKHHVLSDISFEVEKGEFFGIVGRNGSGKSTLLKLLASIYATEKGHIEVAGKLVPFIELGVGFNPELSGRDNVYLNGAMLGFSDKEIDAIYDDIVSFAELEKFMDQKLKNYSSGMQVRLAFSVATRSRADILLVDEVLAVGDADFQRKCYDYFTTLKATGKTVIFISHDMNAIREYCDRVMLIDNGKQVQIGSASEIAEEYLKLFSPKPLPVKEPTKITSEVVDVKQRWGDGSVKLSAKLSQASRDIIKITVKSTANKPVKDQIIGVSIEGPSGEIAYGTNTQILKQKLPALNKGQSLTTTWEIPNIFRDGNYVVAIASHGYAGLPVYDWWKNAIKLDLFYDRQSPYLVSPDIKLEVK